MTLSVIRVSQAGLQLQHHCCGVAVHLATSHASMHNCTFGATNIRLQQRIFSLKNAILTKNAILMTSNQPPGDTWLTNENCSYSQLSGQHFCR